MCLIDGAHKGKYSFNTFTHFRPSYNSPNWIDLIMGMRYPPYTAKNLKQMQKLFMPLIPYPRPGQNKPFNRKRWAMLALGLGFILANKQMIAHFIGA